MPANKIKIHEVAKDYGVQSKVIVDLLKANKAWSLGSDGSWNGSSAPTPGKPNS